MHWAIEAGSYGQTDYVRGSDAATAADAEKIWRKFTGLYFIDARVRRTTDEEDERLKLGDSLLTEEASV